MTKEKAIKTKKKYAKAQVWACSCGNYEVMVFSGKNSNQWFKWTGYWYSACPICSKCKKADWIEMQ